MRRSSSRPRYAEVTVDLSHYVEIDDVIDEDDVDSLLDMLSAARRNLPAHPLDALDAVERALVLLGQRKRIP